MPAKFVMIETLGQLDALFESSFTAPVALLKHSNRCGISSHMLELVGEAEATINVVVIQEHRPISDEIAERTGHRHQSPQVFVIKDGKAIYHATHYGIDPTKIQEHLTKN